MASARSPIDKHLQYVNEYRILLCRHCQHAILPRQIHGHFRRLHPHVKGSEMRQMKEQLLQWSDLIQNITEFIVPSSVTKPIPGLAVYRDGWKCLADLSQCQFICRNEDYIRGHLQRHHQTTRYRRRGKPTKEQQERGKTRPLWAPVVCQRVFASRAGSQYFEVTDPDREDGDRPSDHELDQAEWDRIWQTTNQKWTDVEDRERRMILNGEDDEVNPWLERTGWHNYLMGLDRDELLKMIDEPEDQKEPYLRVIWDGMDQLIRRCHHRLVNRDVGWMIRMEAVRNTVAQTRHTPLQPYMNPQTLATYARHWKRIIIFLARTQQQSRRTDPKYQLTRPQKKAWRRLWKMVLQIQNSNRSNSGFERKTEENDYNVVSDVDVPRISTGVKQSDEDERLFGVVQACLRFCITLLNQPIKQREYESPLICAMALLGLKKDGWCDASNYTPILSGLIKISRFMVIETALQSVGVENPDKFNLQRGSDSSDYESSPNQSSGNCLQHLRDRMNEFMIRGSHCPMEWMLDLRTYGLKIHYNTTATGHIQWIGHRILYKEIELRMTEFRQMTHRVIRETRELLKTNLLFNVEEDDLPVIPWDHLYDNPIKATARWNFLRDERNTWSILGNEWLSNRVRATSIIRRQFYSSNNSLLLNVETIDHWMDFILEFQGKLLFLMHITGGQPARAPEILSIRHSNTPKGDLRNIFIEDGAVVFVTRYHKGYNITGDVKVIHRYLPRPVGEMLVYYLWLVLPFQQKLEIIRWEKDTISSHLWPADSKGQAWTSERMRNILARITMQHLGQRLTIQSYREVVIGISRRYLTEADAFEPDDDDEDGEEEGGNNEIIDEQAGHTSHVAGMIYARGLMERKGEVYNKRQLFRQASERWHRFLGLDAVETTKKRSGSVSFEREMYQDRVERRRRLRRVDIETQFHLMMGQNVELRGVQATALQAIFHGDNVVVVVMPTGSGKSVLFMLPAWCEATGVTVVVVPLIALREQMRQRCLRLGIRCVAWQQGKAADDAQIVLVTPEAALSKEFRDFLTRARVLEQLDRIVIDEAHLILNNQTDFRGQLQQLGKLVDLATQMILLTATLPPRSETTLWTRMGWRSEDVQLFRAATVRPNIHYRVMWIRGHTPADEWATLVARIRRYINQRQGGRVIVYTNTVNQVLQLADELGCGGYHHHADDKDATLAAFLDGSQRVVVATSALGMGLDVPNVRVVIHTSVPRCLLDYAQESGRAGRDGKKSTAVLMVMDRDYQRWKKGSRASGGPETELTGAYLHAPCRRVVIDRYLDGSGTRERCTAGEQPCDGCGGDEEDEANAPRDGPRDQEPGRDDEDRNTARERQVLQHQDRQRLAISDRRRQGQHTEAQELAQAHRMLDYLRGRCPWCVIHGEEKTCHRLSDCPHHRETEEVARFQTRVRDKVRGGKLMRAYSGCFRCFAPQEWCHGWTPGDEARQRYRPVPTATCQYEEVIWPLWAALWLGDPHYRTGLRERMTQTGFLPARTDRPASPTGAATSLAGMTFVFTGSLETLSRHQATELVQRHGARVAQQPPGSKCYVVVGHDATERKRHAIAAAKGRLTALDENAFLQLTAAATMEAGPGHGAADMPPTTVTEEEECRVLQYLTQKIMWAGVETIELVRELGMGMKRVTHWR